MKNTYYIAIISMFLLLAAGSFLVGKDESPVTIVSSASYGEDVLNPGILAQNSDVIVSGTVEKVLPGKWSTTDGSRPAKIKDEIIYTDILVRVDEYLKNPLAEKELIIKTQGGTIGEDSMTSDDPSFTDGEKVILFLMKQKETGTYSLRGARYGKYRIINGTSKRSDVLPEDIRSLPLDELKEAILRSQK